MENKIKPIEKSTIHKICSGQVVLNLSMAVKELVENSIDADSTVIEVRLKDYGSEIIEVIDNGSGVHPDNFEALTLKHHTSKLENFSDLLNVDTYGFRGEALSSLCALSDLSIVTRHVSQTCGSKITFDNYGRIAEIIPFARQVGTTVCLSNIFSTLPVRHKEFERNKKKEFAKMISLLSAYCLVTTNTKIVCTNQPKKSARITLLSTEAGKTVRDNISCLFGSKQLNNILEIINQEPDDEILSEMGLKNVQKDMFKLEGYISSCEHGAGRSTNDRQFCYINSRPCDIVKVTKLVNEIYHQFNLHQYPFLVLNIRVDKTLMDINVTPDKRMIFLEHEKLLLATIKTVLLKMYQDVPSTLRISNIVSFTDNNSNVEEAKTFGIRSLDKFRASVQKKNTVDCQPAKREVNTKTNKTEIPPTKRMKLGNMFQFSEVSNINSSTSTEMKLIESTNDDDLTVIVEQRFLPDDNESEKQTEMNKNQFIRETTDQCNVTHHSEFSFDCENFINTNENENELSELITIPQQSDDAITNKESVVSNFSNNDQLVDEFETEIKISQSGTEDLNSTVVAQTPSCQLIVAQNTENNNDNFASQNLAEHTGTKMTPVNEFELKKESGKNDSNNEINQAVKLYVDDTEVVDSYQNRKCYRLELTIDSLLEKIKNRMNFKPKQPSCENNYDNKFQAGVDPKQNQLAELELTRGISKDMFAKMAIIGQFNLGFIITRFGSDLFLIDQHATDEKYNFEMLQQTTTLKNQKLVVPQCLELTVMNECTLIENLDVLKKNGFEFEIDETGQPTKRVKLISIPVSQRWQFGKSDIDELLFMLQDAPPNKLCRPSRVRAMFASRACRKSVMIGTALTYSDMRKLVNHMGEIEQPWNCPHGRPTMRHLANLLLFG